MDSVHGYQAPNFLENQSMTYIDRFMLVPSFLSSIAGFEEPDLVTLTYNKPLNESEKKCFGAGKHLWC